MYQVEELVNCRPLSPESNLQGFRKLGGALVLIGKCKYRIYHNKNNCDTLFLSCHHHLRKRLLLVPAYEASSSCLKEGEFSICRASLAEGTVKGL